LGMDMMDGVKRKYVKWILRLDKRTPNYILVEECMKEIERREGNSEKNKWEKKRREVMKMVNGERGVEKEEEGGEEII